MLDENAKIIYEKGKMNKFFLFVKENTAQIAIAIPVLATVYGIVLNYYFYIVNRGYYNYFGIDSQLMLPYNKNNLYQNIGGFVLVLLYWGYAILAVRIFVMRKNYKWKIVCFIIIPLVINIGMFYDGKINLSLLVASIEFMPFQWIMIASLGIGITLNIYPEMFQKFLERLQKKKHKKRNVRRQWNNKDNIILGSVLILASCIIFFAQGYYDNKNLAESKTRFGIVKIENEEYAVIDENEDKLILQQCEIENQKIKINTNTYLCVSNGMIINFRKFETVELIKD